MQDRNSSNTETIRIIDVEKVIAEKNKRLFSLLPGFVIRYLKRIIHQDEINTILENFKDVYGLEFIDKIFESFGVNIIVEGIENLPKDGRFMVAANHPLGGLDGMALMKVVGSVHKDILFPVNDLLLYLPNLKPLFIPINKHGKNTDNIKIFDEAFASDAVILYFPASLCSRKKNGKIMDLDWKKTFISRAKRFKRDIVPAYIKGKNSNFFYNLANIRASSGLKTNIEMLYLVDEMFKQKDKDIIIKFGNPIPWQFFDKSKKDVEWASFMRDHVYSMSSDSL